MQDQSFPKKTDTKKIKQYVLWPLNIWNACYLIDPENIFLDNKNL